MSFNIEVEGGSSVRLPTAGKYVDRDIVVTATGGGSWAWDGVYTYSGDMNMETGTFEVGKRFFRENQVLRMVDIAPCAVIGEEAFYNCPNLESIEISDSYKQHAIGLKIKERAFAHCTKLKTAYLDRCIEIGEDAFYGNSALERVEISSLTIGVQNRSVELGEGAFQYCEKLHIFSIPGVNFSYIGKQAFEGCESIEILDFAKCGSVGERAFCGCSALTSVDMTCDFIYANAFLGCTNLSAIILHSMCDIDISAVLDTKIVSAEGMPTGEGFIYVPTALYESYVADLVPKVIALATAVGMPMDEATATYIATAILRKIEDYPEITGG